MADPSIREGDYRSGWSPPRLPQVGIDTNSQALQQTLTHLNSWTNNFSDAVVNDLDDLAFITEKFTENPDGTVSISDPLRLPDRKLYFSEYGVSNNDYMQFLETNNDYGFYADNNMVFRLPSFSLVGCWNTSTNATITSATESDFGAPYITTITKPAGWNSYDVILFGHITVAAEPNGATLTEWMRFNTRSRIGTTYGLAQSTTFPFQANTGWRHNVPISQRREDITVDVEVALRGYRGKGESGGGVTVENGEVFALKLWKS